MNEYYPSEIVAFTHGFPHISFNFSLLHNPKFSFDDPLYLESLVMVAIIPLVILALSMIGFIIYFCCVKIKRSALNKEDSTSCYCSVCMIIIFVMIALGSIGVMVYGSIQIHEGVNATLTETSKLNQSFALVTNDLKTCKLVLDNLTENINRLESTSVNRTVIDELHKTVAAIDDFVYSLPYKDAKVENYIPWLIRSFQDIEEYRTIITFSLIGVQSIICLFALIGICFQSRCLLISTVFIGLLCLVICYIYIGIVLMVDVASADFCINPYEYIEKQAMSELEISNRTTQYYLVCSTNMQKNSPFQSLLFSLGNEISALESIAADLSLSTENLILNNIRSNAMQLKEFVRSMSSHLDCQPINVVLKQLVYSACFSTFDGFFILSISTVCVCLALTVILCAAPKTWKKFSRKKDTEELDLDDVFLPPPVRQPSISRTNNPMYISPEERYTNHISNSANPPVATNTLSFFRHSEEDMTLLDQPPPEYSPPRPGSVY